MLCVPFHSTSVLDHLDYLTVFVYYSFCLVPLSIIFTSHVSIVSCLHFLYNLFGPLVNITNPSPPPAVSIFPPEQLQTFHIMNSWIFGAAKTFFNLFWKHLTRPAGAENSSVPGATFRLPGSTFWANRSAIAGAGEKVLSQLEYRQGKREQVL
jgi:hypothetical protein